MPTLQLILFLSIPFFLKTTTNAASPNPFTAKATLIRYWDRKTPNQRPHPSFFLSKLSPLSALDSTTYSSLLSSNPSSLIPHLLTFCSAAHLLCSPSLTSKSPKDSNFAKYNNVNFTTYGTAAAGGQDSFKKYSKSQVLPVDVFSSYSRASAGHDETFTTYSPNGTIITDNFTSYATTATGGSGDFTSYGRLSKVSELTFKNYETGSNGHAQNFTSYADDTSGGDETFTSYGKGATGVPTNFRSYANNSGIFISTFKSYGEGATGPSDTFTKYGNNPGSSHQNFQSYSENANSGNERFSSYRGDSDVGDDKFQSYGKGGNHPIVDFKTYGHDYKTGEDHFKNYGENANNPEISFTTYKGNPTDFKSYAKTGVVFKDYQNTTTPSGKVEPSGKTVNRWVEPGKFFRESSLKEGIVMPMPDIRDKMLERSFLPRDISGKLPFNAIELGKIFNAPAGTGLGRAIADTISECERAPSRGETKRCATSAEDMIDFAVSVLGNDAVPRTTESTSGSGGNILIGNVKGINGGRVTKSVSCHQSLFPYLVYYCHSVPKVRVYEAEILSVESKKKINQGVAICHLDTADWSAGHGAFVALGSKPGAIEVCHWIFEGDLTWATAD
ncbi:BURP domain-containing protein [Dioscorea alata]|uniref:BURP domain-containing protein n=1 Tax=Dioscorea alata TaxID=55571 RepID=A0ACB7V1S1_DIOAL|nr:BURP domain-containing protein [Dioscorea alata]